MKKFLLFIAVISIVYGCGNNTSDQPVAEDDTTNTAFSWEASLNDSTGRLEMIRNESSIPDSLNLQTVIAFLNKKYPNIQTSFIKSSGDTVYVRIPEATYLTQQMGSSGPTMFFAEAVYNITEIAGIRNVNFDFEEGDHAQPGTYTRDDFKDQ
jgi:hypothetical protein